MSTPQRTARLAVVATPIGNLADLSPRAAETLKTADIVLCEDTRHSKPLLDRVGSHARLVSCHAHNERERKDLVVNALLQGQRVALVSDAGAPAVSDPGGRIVEEVVAAGHEVEVLPGPSALVAALMGAGIDVSRFAFLGFLPKSGKPRRVLLEAAAKAGLGVALYEAPQRVSETLVDLFEALGPRRVVVARELTKLHETFHRGTLSPTGALQPPFVEKGEVVILVEGGEAKEEVSASDVEAMLRDDTLPPKERAKRLAAAVGIPVKEAYARVQAASRREDPAAEVKAALEHLGRAAAALVEADAAARRERGEEQRGPEELPAQSDIPGADALMRLIRDGTALRAPVEGLEAAKAVLAALAAVDSLLDALAFEAEGQRRDD